MRILRDIAIVILAALPFLTAAGAFRRDAGEALYDLEKRVAAGDAKAMFDLALFYERGYDTIPPDTARSLALLRSAAENGLAEAQNYLGFRFFNGDGLREDVDSALYWIGRAAGNGDARAANNLGFLLIDGGKLVRDYKKAAYWLSRAAADSLPTAMSLLGDLFRDGNGVNNDTLRAASLYEAAGRKGLRDAEMKLIDMMGERWNMLPADSALSLGKSYFLGGLPRAGVTLLEREDLDGCALANALLGDAYTRSLGVAYDYEKSMNHFLRAALLGDPGSIRAMAELLEMFPDALSAPTMQDTLRELNAPREASDAEYWRRCASALPLSPAL